MYWTVLIKQMIKLKRYCAIYDDRTFLSDKFKRMVGYDLNIENPKTFNERFNG